MKRKWKEYNEKLGEHILAPDNINDIFGKEKELLSILIENFDSKKHDSGQDTKTPISSQDSEYCSESPYEDENDFEFEQHSIEPNVDCDLCDECSYKCFQCREETRASLMWSLDNLSEQDEDTQTLLSILDENDPFKDDFEKTSLYDCVDDSEQFHSFPVYL